MCGGILQDFHHGVHLFQQLGRGTLEAEFRFDDGGALRSLGGETHAGIFDFHLESTPDHVQTEEIDRRGSNEAGRHTLGVALDVAVGADRNLGVASECDHVGVSVEVI